MAVKDFLEKVGTGLEKGLKTTGRVAEAIGPALGKSIAEEEAGYAPEIAKEKRVHEQSMQDAAIDVKAQALENQLAIGQKYGTLTPEQQQQYVDEITKLYSHPSQAGTLMEKLRKAVHPGGAVATPGASAMLKNATPQGGTAFQDEQARIREAQARYHARPATPQQQYYDSFARKLGLSDSTEMTSEQWEQAFKSKKTSEASPVNWKDIRIAGNVYAQNPRTLEMKFIGKDSEVTEHKGVANITVGDPPHLIQIPTITYTSKVTGQPIVDEDGNPLQTAAENAAAVAGALPNPPADQTAPKAGAAPKAKPVTKPAGGVARALTPPSSLPGVGNLPKGSRDLGQKAPGAQERQILESSKQIIASIDDLLPILEKKKNQGGVMDALSARGSFAAYQLGLPSSDPEQDKIIENSALLGVIGASIWSRIGRNRLTYQDIRLHLPKPTDTPKLMYDKVKWLKDNVVPAAQDAIKNPEPDVAGTSSVGRPEGAVGKVTYQGKKYWVDKDKNNLGEAPQ